MGKEVFHEAWMAMLDECFSYLCYVLVVQGLQLAQDVFFASQKLSIKSEALQNLCERVYFAMTAGISTYGVPARGGVSFINFTPKPIV